MRCLALPVRAIFGSKLLGEKVKVEVKFLPLYTTEVYRGWRHSSIHYYPRHYMEVGSEPHAPAALLLVPIQWEAPKPFSTFFGRRAKSFAVAGIRTPDRRVQCLVTVLTTLHRLQYYWGLVITCVRTIATDFVYRS